MLKIAILEDEIVYANTLKEMISSWSATKTLPSVDVFPSTRQFLQAAASPKEYDLIFIDMTLDVDGILFAKQLLKMGFKNTLIFIANSPDRAIDGYKVNAYRYYLKPLKLSDVRECMDYAWDKNISRFFQYSYRGTVKRIPFDSIYFIESTGHYIHIHLKQDQISTKSTLRLALEQCPSSFVRCHRSYVVNAHYLVERSGNSLQLTNNIIIPLSSQYAKNIDQMFIIGKKEKT